MFTRYGFITFFLGVIVFFSFSCEKNNENIFHKNDPDILFQQAILLANKGHFNEAIPLLQKAMELSPDDYDVLLNLGSAYHATGDFRNAEMNYQRAVSIRMEEHEAHLNLGIIYLRRNQLKMAMHELEVSILYDDHRCGLVHAEYGRALQLTGKCDRAIQEYEIAREWSPENEMIYENLGRIYENLGKTDMAKKAYLAGVTRSGTIKGKAKMLIAFLGIKYPILTRMSSSSPHQTSCTKTNKQNWY